VPLIKAVRALKHKMQGQQPTMPEESIFSNEDLLALANKQVLSDSAKEDFCNPSKAVQERFVGSSFLNTYTEAALFLNHVFERVFPSGEPTNLQNFKILDFGCGWGRMLRLLRHNPDLANIELYGADPISLALDICRRSLPSVWLTQVGLLPPTDYRDSLFDLIYAYSVFSHLSMDCHLQWARELHRIIKPGGFVCITLQNRGFIDYCQRFRDGKMPIESGWQKALAGSFTQPNAMELYDSGEFLYAATGGGGVLTSTHYGEAVVPKQFINNRWGEIGFEVIDWWEHPAPHYGGQNRVLLRKF
jgi:2-polyprenyl-3-methyl-5-hydroxy-6-metoxy-1,4-benzoquinol methylase